VGHEELDRMSENRIRELGGGSQLLELAAEVRSEELVDGGEHLRTRAVVERGRKRLLDSRTALAEDLDVRVAEAVDGLEVVDGEEELRLGRLQQVDDLRL